MNKYFAKFMAEFIGTGVLVFAGCGAITINSLSHGQITHLGIALVFGLSIGVMIMAVGSVSGAHFNPAVTLAMASQRFLPFKLAFLYWGAQLAGACSAALGLWLLFGSATNLSLTQPAGEALQTFFLEIILTAILVFVIAAVSLKPSPHTALGAPLAIGGTVTLEALFAGPISGASMNPARSLAPALVSGQFNSLWIYLLAPLIGGWIGIMLYQLMKRYQIEGSA